MEKRELRFNANSELNAQTRDNGFVIAGYAAMFNSPSNVLFDKRYGPFIESINEGSFAKTINEADVRALWNHNADIVLGRNKSGTLKLGEDTRGLEYEVSLADNPVSRSYYETVQRGDVDQSSFGFSAIADDWSADFSHRTLREVQLFDVSPVAYPAYESATIGARAIERLAEARNISIDEVKERFSINDAKIEDEEITPARPRIISRYIEPSSIIRIRGRK